MTMRSRRETITFKHPFRIKGIDRLLPAGAYEVITAEQMLDAYSSAGMPLFYKHWSFGKHFAHREAFYRKGNYGPRL